MKKVFTLFIIFNSFIQLNAQTENKFDSKHELGIHAGFTTGLGFSYRFWPGKIGFQATLLPIKTESDWTDIMNVQSLYKIYGIDITNTKFTSFGLTALFTLDEGKKAKLFTYLGNNYIITNDHETDNIGFGFGISIKTRVSFNIMAGYGAFDVTRSVSYLPTIELGLYYRFKQKN
jgi:hypothetical protein